MMKDLKPNSPEAIAAAWDHLCDTYANDLANPSKRKSLAAVELAVVRKELGVGKGLRILDAGCGPGWQGIELALDGHHVVMTDISSKMLERARAAADAANVADRIMLCHEDIRTSSLAAGSFDAVVSCGTVVSDCGDPDAALSEFSRLLKDGGVALFSVRNLRAWLDAQDTRASFGDAKSWIESGRRLVPQGHEAFDWVFFTVEGLNAACRVAGMDLQGVYPVGIAPPPEDDEEIPSYVKLHIDMVDDAAALVTAWELFAAAGKTSQARNSH